MYNQYGYFVPVKNLNNHCVISVANSFVGSGKPFFSINLNSANAFVDALTKNDIETAKLFVSKDFADLIDLNELQSLCKNGHANMISAKFTRDSKFNFTKSILIVNKQSRANDIILHLHFINQPDSISKWKIFGYSFE